MIADREGEISVQGAENSLNRELQLLSQMVQLPEFNENKDKVGLEAEGVERMEVGDGPDLINFGQEGEEMLAPIAVEVTTSVVTPLEEESQRSNSTESLLEQSRIATRELEEYLDSGSSVTGVTKMEADGEEEPSPIFEVHSVELPESNRSPSLSEPIPTEPLPSCLARPRGPSSEVESAQEEERPVNSRTARRRR